MSLLESTLRHEGFRTKPYQDTLGIWTFGHGLTFITEDESEHIVDKRLTEILLRLTEEHTWLLSSPQSVSEVLVEMCYQLGWTGCHNFTNTWIHLEDKQYKKAADEMLDSKWAKQTPERANQMANIIRKLA